MAFSKLLEIDLDLARSKIVHRLVWLDTQFCRFDEPVHAAKACLQSPPSSPALVQKTGGVGFSRNGTPGGETGVWSLSQVRWEARGNLSSQPPRWIADKELLCPPGCTTSFSQQLSCRIRPVISITDYSKLGEGRLDILIILSLVAVQSLTFVPSLGWSHPAGKQSFQCNDHWFSEFSVATWVNWYGIIIPCKIPPASGSQYSSQQEVPNSGKLIHSKTWFKTAQPSPLVLIEQVLIRLATPNKVAVLG